MEKLLKMAKKVADKAEIYNIEEMDNNISYENGKLQEMESNTQSGVSLRIIKDGKLGFAYTRNLLDREEFINNALDSLKGGIEADYDFPFTKDIPKLDVYNPVIEKISGTQMVDEAKRVYDYLKTKMNYDLLVASAVGTAKFRILNTDGTDISQKNSVSFIYTEATFPGTATGIGRGHINKTFEKMPDDILEEVAHLCKVSEKVVSMPSGKMKVLFMPGTVYTLNWRILSATSSQSVYMKMSPIMDKIGEKIFDDKFTFYDDPTDDTYAQARAFDDEGVKTNKLTLIENGVLKGFYYDLNYAKKLNTKSTGNGYKGGGMFGGDKISSQVVPTISHARIKTGDKSLEELIKSMDKGIILESIMGAHSGNIPNGDYSVGVSSGFYVENGEIQGRVKDVMVAGNIYETLKNVAGIGNKLYPTFAGMMPPVLCDNVSVSSK